MGWQSITRQSLLCFFYYWRSLRWACGKLGHDMDWLDLVPAGLVVAYSLATAVARTSGGRYFIPVDWVFLLYFAIGISQVVVWVNTWSTWKDIAGL